MNIVYENELGRMYNDGTVELTADFRTFDIAHEEYFYLKNHPEDEKAPLLDKFYEKIYTQVAKYCNESGEYTIDCFNERYTCRKISEIEQIHYDAMSDEEKAKHDAEKKKNALNDEINKNKEYLTSTDYIVTKINEVMATGTEDEIAAVKAEYAEQLQKRKEARARINKLEVELKALENIG